MARFLKGQVGGIAEDPPDADFIVLALHEIAHGPGTAHADAEPPEFGVADIEKSSAGSEGIDQALGKTGVGHGFLPDLRNTWGKNE